MKLNEIVKAHTGHKIIHEEIVQSLQDEIKQLLIGHMNHFRQTMGSKGSKHLKSDEEINELVDNIFSQQQE